ncbi:MAG: hypothetical protein K2L55_06445 [Muribaculaceae bacterium]|nr:hypothetical protein [Muribaculaceae bacterium]
MKRFPFLLISLILLCNLGCNNSKSDTTDDTEMEDSIMGDSLIDDDNTESLEFWTADTIIKINPRLVRLMDSLYQYTRNEISLNDVRNNRKWMQEYRTQLCNYYIETRRPDGISDFAMADSIIAEANALWELDKDESTMGTIVSDGIEYTRLIFEQFNEYEKLNSICKSEEQREILLSEFTEWLEVENLFYKIFANCVDLYFWGGSISGVVRTSGALRILKAHIDLYKKEYAIISDSENQWEDNGTFLRPAHNLLIICCKQAVDECYCPGDANSFRYCLLYIEAKLLLNELDKQIDTWCKSRQVWENTVCTDWSRPEYARHTSEVLIKLANIISSIQ